MKTTDDQRSDLLAPCPGYAPQRWTAEEPKAAGWWWCDDKDYEKPCVRRVTMMNGKLQVYLPMNNIWGKNWLPIEMCPPQWRWAGPLPEPQEPSARACDGWVLEIELWTDARSRDGIVAQLREIAKNIEHGGTGARGFGSGGGYLWALKGKEPNDQAQRTYLPRAPNERAKTQPKD